MNNTTKIESPKQTLHWSYVILMARFFHKHPVLGRWWWNSSGETDQAEPMRSAFYEDMNHEISHRNLYG